MRHLTERVRTPSTARSIMSRELSDHEFGIRAPAFDEGVAVAGRFFFARQALLQQHAPQKPPLTAVPRFSARFVRFVEMPLRGLRNRHRLLQTTEFVAGLMCELLNEYEWQRPLHEQAGPDFPLSLLPTRASLRTKMAWKSFRQEPAWKARARQDGYELVNQFLTLRMAVQRLLAEVQEASPKANPNAPIPSIHDEAIRVRLYTAVNCFMPALVYRVLEALHRYPTHLRYFLASRLLGAFIAQLIAQDCEHVSANGSSSAVTRNTRRRRRERS